MHSIVGNHGFIDGNKRTAWLLVEILIARSSYILAIPDGERVDDIVVSVAADAMSFDELVARFKPRLIKT